MEQAEQKRQIRNMHAMLKRRATRVAPARKYDCIGGPFAGQQLKLRTGTTCHLVIKGMRGRYVANGTHEVRWVETN